MESANYERVNKQVIGFTDGIDCAVRILKLCLASDTHLNVHVRNIINQTFAITIKEIIDQRAALIEEYANAVLSKPSKQ